MRSLAAADQVVFISRHGANDARELSLVPDERINVVPPAVDHTLLGLEMSPRAWPDGAERSATGHSFSALVPISCTRTACSRSGFSMR